MSAKSEPYFLSPGEQYKKKLTFDFTRADISGSVTAPGGKSLDQDVCFEIFGADGRVTAAEKKEAAALRAYAASVGVH